MNYSAIKYFDIANGEGVRTSLFVSGCRRHCPYCFNGEAWRFDAGEPFDEAMASRFWAANPWSQKTRKVWSNSSNA